MNQIVFYSKHSSFVSVSLSISLVHSHWSRKCPGGFHARRGGFHEQKGSIRGAYPYAICELDLSSTSSELVWYPLSTTDPPDTIFGKLYPSQQFCQNHQACRQAVTLIGANKVFSAFSNGESWGLETPFLSNVEIQCDRVAYHPDI